MNPSEPARTAAQKPDRVATLLVSLDVDDEPVLDVLLGRDGAINRMGTGAEGNDETERFTGVTENRIFERLDLIAGPVLSSWIGEYRSKQKVGKTKKLRFTFRMMDGSEHHSVWEFGSGSQGPPREVHDLLMTVIEATDAWYQQQKG